MADLFVSYAREDKEFARALSEALRQRSRDVWIDWEDIPLTSTWLDEIFAGIESSHVFVAIITPHLVASRVCALELARAVERGKRVVPVVREEVDAAELHPALNVKNWVFIRQTDDFEAKTAELEEALDIDLDWLHAHTRLTVRAADWVARQRNRSLLLRGHDLKEAEHWLSVAAGKSRPETTALQREYVGHSRASQKRARRITAVAIVSAVFIAAVLGVSTWVQNQKARSRALAGAAASRVAAEPERALQLADEAGGVWPTDEAEAALRRTLLASHGRRTLSGHAGGVTGAAFSPDDRQVLSTSEDGTARLWTLDSSAEPLVLGRSRFAPAAAFSPDGKSVATAADDGSIRLWNAQDGSARNAWSHPSAIVSTAFDASGRCLLTRDSERAIQVWDVDTGSVRWAVPEPGFDSAVFSPDGSRVVAGGVFDVMVFDVATGRKVLHLPAQPTAVLTTAFSSDGARILSTWEDGEARLWDAGSGANLATLTGHGDPVDRIVADPSGRWVATSTHWVATESGGGPSAIGDKTVRVWNVADGGAVSVLRGHSREINAIDFSPGGELLVTASNDQSARIWDPETGRALRVLRGHHGAVSSAAFSHDGRWIVTAGEDHTVRLWESGFSSSVMRGRPLPDQWRDYGRFSADGRFVTLSVGEAPASVTEVETGRTIAVPPAADEDGVRAELSPDGVLMATLTGAPETASGGDEVRIFDLRKPDTVMAVLRHDSPVYSARFNPTGTRVITAGEDATARIWETANGHEVARLAHHDRVLDATFSHAGDRAVTASRDTSAVVWSAATGERIAELQGHADSVLKAEFSPDDRLIATVGADSTIRLWEPATGEELAVFRWNGVTPRSIAFGADCESLVVTDDSGAEQRFPCGACGDVDGLRTAQRRIRAASRSLSGSRDLQAE